MPEEPTTAPGNEVDIEQEAVGRENVAGGGEWPDPDTPPTEPAGGEVPPERSRGRERGDSADDPPGPSSFKDLLEADPVAGGSASIGDE